MDLTLPENIPSSELGERRYSSGRKIYTSLPPIDEFLGGFSLSELVLVDSSDRFIFDLTHMVCVNSIHTLGEEVVWIEGGNSVDPYKMVNLCKRFRLGRRDVLDGVNIARAFTAYQMTSLVEEELEKEVERTRCGAVVISCFPDLFLNKEMWWSEAFNLMKQCFSTVQEVVRDHEVMALVTNYGLTKLLRKRSLRTLLYDGADRVLRMENRRKSIKLSLPGEGRSMLYHPVPHYQTTLEEFIG